MPKLHSKVKPISKTPKESVKPSVPTIQALFEADLQARFEIAQEYESHGETIRCFFHPIDGHLLGLGDTNSRLLTIALNAAKKNPDSIHYTVEQVLVFRSDADDDTNGKMFVKIQGNICYVGQTGDDEKAFFDLGLIQKPVWKTKVAAYDSRTGVPLERVTMLQSFVDQFTIPYSIDLDQSLARHFRKCSFVLKEGNRKWTIGQDQFLSGDFEGVLNHVKPKFRRQDGSVE